MKGKLFLIPVPLGTGAIEDVLPQNVMLQVRQIRHFVVEHAKTARAFLKTANMPIPIQEISMGELNEHTPKNQLEALLLPALEGHDLGLVSEAGCPAVADPGAELVALAHAKGIQVVPMVGPSSLLLALMGSGLNGQRFAFHGYLPAKDEERRQALRLLENESKKRDQTQLFIETPYRNKALFEALLQHCQPSTRLCLATDLTLASESIITHRIADWRRQPAPDMERRPTIFLILA